ncbi:MAG TPA: hypothetical protein DD670_12545 [Planctomycetaceae bacterium]|nr:hypothetical protein [Planctomycetaceae bacterium]
MTIKEPNGEDCRFTAYRWHVRAPITFDKSLKVEIERRSFAKTVNPATGKPEQHDFKYRPDFCSSVAFWYQTEPAKREWPFPPVEDRINKEILLDTADMIDQIKTSGGARARQAVNRVCTLKRALYVDNAKVGGTFEVPCRVDEEGIYSISVFQCLFRNGGIWRVTLDGPKGPVVLDKAMDFHDPYLAWRENRPENFLHGTVFEKKIGLHKLSPGDYVFRFECLGANPLSREGDDDIHAPGLNCRLDGISLRRFPWDDLYGQLQEYLADEKVLSEGWADEARETVSRLDAAVQQFRNDTGDYPRSLDELVTRPGRLADAHGRWPYAASIPRDPWGQVYHYERPGRFHLDGFDVYSFRGNSRDPVVWIGNWKDPFRFEHAVEGENLAVVDRTNGVKTAAQQIQFRPPPPLSNQRMLYVEFNNEGDFIDLALPESISPGRYRLRMRLATANNYGTLRASLNGETVVPRKDTFSHAMNTEILDLGVVNIRPGGNVLRFESIGQNPESRGYRMGLDALILTPIE